MQFCHCGCSSENEHNCRHLFTPTTTLTYDEKQGYILDFTNVKVDPRYNRPKDLPCTVPQCGKSKSFHDGVMIKHPYQTDHVDEELNIKCLNLYMPDSTLCKCGDTLGSHKPETINYRKCTKMQINVCLLNFRQGIDWVKFFYKNQLLLQK